ncbi:MAG: ABC transporter ATP-binding protein [Chloroflexi bacterium]|nr:ABC transporter ATP-binding protein [Chloroflexota bacterium]MCL5074424.1 ABC transporter ATP-binding protein [Chloroflexota bacterium]
MTESISTATKAAVRKATAVEIQGVSKFYGTREGTVHALDDVSFNIKGGEFLALLGPSGCGKSTLLMIVAGLISKSKGTVLINNLPVEKPQTDIGIVFQNHVLLDWRKVIDNIMLQIEIRRMERAVYRQRAMELLHSVGLSGFEHKYPFELSGGMRQRVSICRALIHDPSLLLMDEPFGALDALTREQLILDLQQIWQETAKTVLFVTHSIDEAVFLADRVVVMTPRPGRIAQIFEIDLPRPRHLAVREMPEFGKYTVAIRDLFQSYGILTEHRAPSTRH